MRPTNAPQFFFPLLCLAYILPTSPPPPFTLTHFFRRQSPPPLLHLLLLLLLLLFRKVHPSSLIVVLLLLPRLHFCQKTKNYPTFLSPAYERKKRKSIFLKKTLPFCSVGRPRESLNFSRVQFRQNAPFPLLQQRPTTVN